MEREFALGNAPCDVLFAGNSHVMMGIDPRLFANAASFPSLGEPYTSTYYKMRYLLANRSPLPRTLVLQLDLHSFSDQNFNAQTGYRATMYLDYFENARITGNYWTSFQNWTAYQLAPYSGRSADLFDYVLGNRATNEEITAHWKATSFAAVKDRQYQAYQVAAKHLAYRRWNDPEQCLYFERIADFCANNEMRLVWVRIPVSGEYFEEARNQLPISEWQSLVESMIQKHRAIRYLDYHSMFFGRPEMFTDANHLSPEGRALFSQKLLADMCAEGLAKAAAGVAGSVDK